MPYARGSCPVPGCPEVTDGGRCGIHKGRAERQRGSRHERGYGAGHNAFRVAVLRRDPTCVMSDCTKPSQHADHHWVHPTSGVVYDRRALVAAGLDPTDPQYGRGLCAPHHSTETARLQPGGWHAQ